MSKNIQKSFPADTTLDELTFLNDPKVDAELYAFYQTKSIGENGETRVYKKDLPSQAIIAKQVLKRKSRNTVGTHLRYLKDNGYIEDKDNYFVLPKANIYFKIPLDLLKYFIDVLKEDVIKTYIYLGQRYKFKPEGYVFTNKEIAEHIGIDYQHCSSSITNYIAILEKLDLIKIVHYYEEGKPYMKIVKFSTDVPKVQND